MIIWKLGEKRVSYYRFIEKDKPHFGRQDNAAHLEGRDVEQVLTWLRAQMPWETFGAMAGTKFVRSEHPATGTPQPKLSDFQMPLAIDA